MVARRRLYSLSEREPAGKLDAAGTGAVRTLQTGEGAKCRCVHGGIRRRVVRVVKDVCGLRAEFKARGFGNQHAFDLARMAHRKILCAPFVMRGCR